jgi:DNA-binding HxlR family transcriptional regulator
VRRTYGQYCSLAKALDMVGERWTLLIVRELLVRPKRFGELLDGLPGIGRNLLAARLRQLEGEGLIQRREAEGTRVYGLTDDGRGLAPALTELSRWGAARLGPLGEEEAFQGQWVMGTMAAMANVEATRAVHESYQFDVEGDMFYLRVEDGDVSAYVGRADDPDLIVRTTPQVLAAIGAGEQSVVDALTEQALGIEGSQQALEHALAIFGSVWGVEET